MITSEFNLTFYARDSNYPNGRAHIKYFIANRSLEIEIYRSEAHSLCKAHRAFCLLLQLQNGTKEKSLLEKLLFRTCLFIKYDPIQF